MNGLGGIDSVPPRAVDGEVSPPSSDGMLVFARLVRFVSLRRLIGRSCRSVGKMPTRVDRWQVDRDTKGLRGEVCIRKRIVDRFVKVAHEFVQAISSQRE